MKRMIMMLIVIFVCCLLVIPVTAAPSEPVITLQPQSPNYPEYSVATYSVKVEGSNLQATWYMEWMGKTYIISQFGEYMQDWEPYAGERYGASKIDDNTFMYVFEGIEYDLDGAYIWCVVEDGHYSVTSQKNRISVGNENMPPEIVSIPSRLTVEQGDPAEIRCVAKSTDESELFFLWYETDSGKREDIYAVNRGSETSDYLICDTDTVGTRNYICQVSSENGGLTYSSVVSVTVTEKQTVERPEEEPTQPIEPVTQPTKPVTEPTEPVTEPTEPVTDSTEPTTEPAEPVTEPTETIESATEPTTIPATNDVEHSKAQNEDGNNSAMLWIIPGAVLLVAVTAVVTVYIVKRK